MTDTAERKPLLCRMGLHRWRGVPETFHHTDLAERWVERCTRCGKKTWRIEFTLQEGMGI